MPNTYDPGDGRYVAYAKGYLDAREKKQRETSKIGFGCVIPATLLAVCILALVATIL